MSVKGDQSPSFVLAQQLQKEEEERGQKEDAPNLRRKAREVHRPDNKRIKNSSSLQQDFKDKEKVLKTLERRQTENKDKTGNKSTQTLDGYFDTKPRTPVGRKVYRTHRTETPERKVRTSKREPKQKKEVKQTLADELLAQHLENIEKQKKLDEQLARELSRQDASQTQADERLARSLQSQPSPTSSRRRDSFTSEDAVLARAMLEEDSKQFTQSDEAIARNIQQTMSRPSFFASLRRASSTSNTNTTPRSTRPAGPGARIQHQPSSSPHFATFVAPLPGSSSSSGSSSTPITTRSARSTTSVSAAEGGDVFLSPASQRFRDRLSPATRVTFEEFVSLNPDFAPLFFSDPPPIHRMRGGALQGDQVDVDRMSYEELLELQERVGFVSQGASTESIEQLPTTKFRVPAPSTSSSSITSSSGSKSAEEEDPKKNCNICLNDFEDGDDIRSLPCFHFFHREEIDQWLKLRDTCPVCKTPATRNP